MVVVLVVLGVVAVVAMALASVGIVVRRLGPEPARQVFEYNEEVNFVVEALPDEITAQLSWEDVQRILRLHLDFLHRKGVARSGGDLPEGEGPIVVDLQDGADYVLQRGRVAKFTPAREHVLEVITAQLAYFEAIGAMEEVQGHDPSTGPTGAPIVPADPAAS